MQASVTLVHDDWNCAMTGNYHWPGNELGLELFILYLSVVIWHPVSIVSDVWLFFCHADSQGGFGTHLQ